MLARLEELRHRRRLAGDRGGREIIHLCEFQIDRQLFAALAAAELIGHLHRHRGLDRRHALVEIVHIDVEEFSVVHVRLRHLGGVAGEIGKDAHDEGQLDQFFRIVWIFVSDMNPRLAIPRNELLSRIAVRGHHVLLGVTPDHRICDRR